jgi:hypothetical protein
MERPSSDDSKSLKVNEYIIEKFLENGLLRVFAFFKVELGISIQQIIDVVKSF